MHHLPQVHAELRYYWTGKPNSWLAPQQLLQVEDSHSPTAEPMQSTTAAAESYRCSQTHYSQVRVMDWGQKLNVHSGQRTLELMLLLQMCRCWGRGLPVSSQAGQVPPGWLGLRCCGCVVAEGAAAPLPPVELFPPVLAVVGFAAIAAKA